MNDTLERTSLLDKLPFPCLDCSYILIDKFYCFPYFELAFIEKIIMITIIDIRYND